MKALIGLELRKAFFNKWFLLTFGLACLLAISASAQEYNQMMKDATGFGSNKYYFPVEILSVFMQWMLVNGGHSQEILFFILLPLFSLLPFTWSLLSEQNSSYSAHVIARSSQGEYYGAKLIAVFLSAAVVVGIPLILNFVIDMCFAPFIMPDVREYMLFAIYKGDLWSDIFYTNPLLYCFLFTGLLTFFSGCWACFVTGLSFFIKKRSSLIFVSYLSLLVLKFVNEEIIAPRFHINEGFTPFAFMSVTAAEGLTAHLSTVVIELSIFVAFTALVFFLNRKRDVL